MLKFASSMDLLVVGGFIALQTIAGRVINRQAPNPYMDEVFHVAQTQTICDGDFHSWDPKITTLPGLYYAAAGAARLGQMVGVSTQCDTATLRAMNGATYLALTWLVLRLARLRGRRSQPPGHCLLTALNVATFPVLFFCGLLYYTDALSVLLVFGSFALAQPAAGAASASPIRLATSALVSLAACCVRQNNVVWAAFIAGEALLRVWADAAVAIESPTASMFTAATFRALWRHPVRAQLAAVAVPFSAVFAAAGAFVLWNGGIVVGDRTQHEAVFHFAQFGYACALLSAYAAADVADITVRLSTRGWGGLSDGQRAWLTVLGQACGVTIAAVSASGVVPAVSKQTAQPSKMVRSRNGPESNAQQPAAEQLGAGCQMQVSIPRLLLALLALSAITAVFAALQDRYTYEHAYLLADNRHYAFYIWNRVLKHRRWLRLSLVPVYVGGVCVFGAKVVAASLVATPTESLSLAHNPVRGNDAAAAHGAQAAKAIATNQSRVGVQRGLLLSAGFLLATALVVVPARLIEPRYFILPALFGLLLAPPASRNSSLAVLAAHVLVNAATVYVFAFRPFSWGDGSTARFMW